MFLLLDCPSVLVDCCWHVSAAVFVILATAAIAATTAIIVVIVVITIVVSSGIHTQGHEDNHQSWAVLFHLRLPLLPPSCGTMTVWCKPGWPKNS